MSDIIVKTTGLCKEYSQKIAVNHLNMEIKRGEIYGFIGENGAGKTTTIRLLTGLARPTSGNVELFGKAREKELRLQRSRIGCIIESPALYPDMTAVENLEVQRIQRGIPGKDCIREALKTVNLEDTGKKKAKNFSLGMRQRLALAVALLGNPEFLILDEPTNGLDPMGIIEMRELLKRINKEKEVTMLISSHLLSELYLLATSYGIIHKGNLIEQLTLDELNQKCKKYVSLEVSDINKAVNVIENKLMIHDYEICVDHTIKLNDFPDKTEVVSSTLYNNGVGIRKILLLGDDLETYFTCLIGGKQYGLSD